MSESSDPVAVACRQCGERNVEPERVAWATPVCFACVPSKPQQRSALTGTTLTAGTGVPPLRQPPGLYVLDGRPAALCWTPDGRAAVSAQGVDMLFVPAALPPMQKLDAPRWAHKLAAHLALDHAIALGSGQIQYAAALRHSIEQLLEKLGEQA